MTYFGVEDPSVAIPEMQHASDSKHCRRCGAAYVYDAIYLGHLGRYRCPSCGQQRPAPAVAAERIELDGTRGSRFELTTPAGSAGVELPLPGAVQRLQRARRRRPVPRPRGPARTSVVAGLRDVRAAFGRAERIAIGDVELQVLLMKNPAGANEILRTLVLEHEELDVLAILNDRTADGRDVSWVWDADFEMLADPGAPGDLRRHARRRARGAPEVRGRAHRPPARDPGPRPRARRGARGGAVPVSCTRCRRTPRCSSFARSSRRGATRSGSGSPSRWVGR